jgi:hypothetical protein
VTSSSRAFLRRSFFNGRGRDYEIFVYDADGRLARIIRRDLVGALAEEVQPLLFAFVDSFAAAQGFPPEVVTEFREDYLERPRPERLPVFTDLVVDAMGHLWVERYRPRYGNIDPLWETGPREWDVFDSGGRWIGTVLVPDRVRVREIGRDYVLGVWRDELGVEFVRTYEMDRL